MSESLVGPHSKIFIAFPVYTLKNHPHIMMYQFNLAAVWFVERLIIHTSSWILLRTSCL